MTRSDDPVIIGVGQATWRERDRSRTPIDALEAVATRAGEDTGSARVLPAVDAIVHVPFFLTQVPELAGAMPRNAGAALADRLGLRAASFSADVGGDLPQRFVAEFAGRVGRGDVGVALICGTELVATFFGALRAGEALPDWSTGRSDDPGLVSSSPDMYSATEQAHRLHEPIHAYPLIESALRHAHALGEAEHRQRLGELVAAMSRVAAKNEYAWTREELTPEAVLSTDAGNRMIAWPYTKLMNSVIAVDQAAAVILTTAGRARALGVDESRFVYLRGGAHAHDSWLLGERPTLHTSPALRAASSAALEQAQVALSDITHFDLYSCFPSAVQVACEAIGIDVNDPRGLTVTGGMSLFGGPGNNYGLHGIATLVDCLRRTQDGLGLLSANGGYLTKHAVGVYGRRPGREAWRPRDCADLQARLDSVAGPELVEEGSGALTVDGHTVHYSRGEPSEAIVLGTLADGRRCVAVAGDDAVIQAFIADDCVGRTGTVTHRDGRNNFSLA